MDEALLFFLELIYPPRFKNPEVLLLRFGAQDRVVLVNVLAVPRYAGLWTWPWCITFCLRAHCDLQRRLRC